ncbi:MAG: MarR family transcriptional regulator [Clostridia bacterium]|nr:MarR family transcriptional regulator [Clostridia bacterium]MCR4906418.1 MarR family transcriptional regulator [Clostridiales bacterium]
MSKKYDALKLENQLCFPLYAASREVTKLYHPMLTDLNLTYTQYIVMMVLWETDPITEKEMGKRLHLDSGTLTPVLKSLEAKNFITRSRSKEDERVVNVDLTDEGRALRDKAVGIPAQIGGRVKLEADEAKTLYELLYKLLANLENE